LRYGPTLESTGKDRRALAHEAHDAIKSQLGFGKSEKR